MKDDVIIIGGGLGGLECGFILARHGMKVTVLESSPSPGGCLQTFSRKGHVFDTGFHYVGGIAEGECLHPFFKYFGLLDLPWKQLDKEGFEEIVFPDASYTFASGFDAFRERLCSYFPGERGAVRKITETYEEVISHMYDNLYPGREDGRSRFLTSGAYDFLNSLTSDRRLRDVVSGSSLKMELSENLPLFVFSEINGSFIQSSWRLSGGGSQIASSLAGSIRNMGGEVRTSCRVTSILEEDGRAKGVVTSEGETLHAGTVISDIHPASLMSLVPECRQMRRSFRSRISSLRNTAGMFTANIILKENTVPYMNRNIFVHSGDADLWHPDPARTTSVMISHYPGGDGFSRTLDLLSPMDWTELEAFSQSRPLCRGEEYEKIKERKLKECISLASNAIPGLESAVESVFTSTPLTYSSYTGTPFGSAYGICKDWHSPMTTMLSPRTPLANLYMTGQNLYLHGILGTTMTAVFTCAEIVGADTLTSEILQR